MAESIFSKLSDDLVLNILHKLEEDPRNWARIACVSTKLSSLIRNVCYMSKCSQSIPAIVSDLLPSPAAAAPPGDWASLYKLAVCCPGLLHSGVLLENSDFGLERELGPDENYRVNKLFRANGSEKSASSSDANHGETNSVPDCVWSLYDDLLYDTLYTDTEAMSRDRAEMPEDEPELMDTENDRPDFSHCKRRKVCRPFRAHLASGVWNLSREQGNKLLASRFKGDCLYICDWPGCIHVEEKRNYMLFRGVFKNFKQSRVWRTINDGNRSKIDLNCAFCASKQTWDLHSSFCLRRNFGFHDDGEPVVRAYVCENGHVSGAWTDWPLYT
ncbi:phytochrome A-associated F-box protein [Andrographis paniculata]|uniref:phytochrome A-associated F-box protein n=1 Tax=Andrographis paniculata TaxID=175694 RepID=UPI0021E774FB|nr:phytochrome A-associated F-box protein [Andrographis paniculata]